MNWRNFLIVIVSALNALAVLFILASFLLADREVSRLDDFTNRDDSTENVMSFTNSSRIHDSGLKLAPIVSLPSSVEFRDRNEPANVSAKLIELHWTSIKDGEVSLNFFSAYYERRIDSSHKKAVIIVLGYFFKKETNVPTFCALKYSNGSVSCLNIPAVKKHPVFCFAPTPRSFLYECWFNASDEPPQSVMMSTSSNCEPDQMSAEIPVGNRYPAKATMKFGVCVNGPIVQYSRKIFLDLIEFIEISTLFGAEVITFYVNETQVDADILKYIQDHYPDTVRLIGWKEFKKWYPFHYYGQLLMVTDCHYRSMYEVEYLAMIDLDEMILPVKHDNWLDMIKDVHSKDKSSGYRFQNAFFNNAVSSKLEILPNCGNLRVPKYFTQTNRLRCFPGFNYRTKMIIRPSFVKNTFIHYVCNLFTGYSGTANVPVDIGILGHYRGEVPDDCKGKQSYQDTFARKYFDRLTKTLCSKVNSSQIDDGLWT